MAWNNAKELDGARDALVAMLRQGKDFIFHSTGFCFLNADHNSVHYKCALL